LKSKAIILALAAASCLTIAHAQQSPENAVAPVVLPSPPQQPIQVPSNATAEESANVTPEQPTPAPAKAPPKPVAIEPPKPEIPPGPPPPVRSPTAILRVLDKVTAETLRFEAPVGRRVRYKTLIFTVKTCETRGPAAALPRPSAYLVIDSEPLAPPGAAARPSREIYRGWMFADSPDLHPFEHPVYDAWLESCTSSAPAP